MDTDGSIRATARQIRQIYTLSFNIQPIPQVGASLQQMAVVDFCTFIVSI
jgi:hypothetical protein